MFSLNDLLRWRSQIHPSATALVDQRGDRVSYGRLIERVDECAATWRRRGVNPGEVVALLDTNSVVYFVNLFALTRIRAVPALLNWRLTAAENRDLLDLVKPVAVAAGPDLVDRLPAGSPELRVVLDPVDDGRPRNESCPADGPSLGAERPSLPPPPSPRDVFALAFSSGTTGQPKAIPMRHESLARSAMIDSADIVGMHVGARQLMVAPTFHLAGLANTVMGLARGAEIHLRTGFDPGAVLDDIEQLRIQYMTAVPAMFQAMVQEYRSRPPGTHPDTSTVMEMSYGASPIAPELVREVGEIFPGCRLRQFYGMTEIAGALTTLTPEDHDPDGIRHSSAGRVNPGFEVRLVDRDGNDVPDGEPGQILIRGQAVMHGYWRNPEATAEAIVDGWLASGDIAVRNDGYLTIMDRAKDMIVSGGENVYPAEVEAALYEHPKVADVAVFGIPDDRFGERVHAVVVAIDGAQVDGSVTLDGMQEFCRPRLAGYKLPRSIELRDALPRNATGKILKRDLRAPYWAGRERSV